MAFTLQSNKSAGSIINSINITTNLLFKSMQKLSSGLKINSAADDPAGLVISEKMRAQIASLNQEIENTKNMINKYETASSSSLQLRGMLTEMRTLAVAASNSGVNDDAIRQAYQSSLDSLVTSYNNVISNSSFASQKLLDGSEGSITTVALVPNLDLSDDAAIADAMNTVDQHASNLDSSIISMGATQKNDLESALRNKQVESQNLTAAESQIRDADMALEFTNLLRNQMLLGSATSLLSHSFISQLTTIALLTGA